MTKANAFALEAKGKPQDERFLICTIPDRITA